MGLPPKAASPGISSSPAMASMDGASMRWSVPAYVRRIVRRYELGLICLGLLAGQIAGVLVAGIISLANWMHMFLYGIAFESHLSSLTRLGHPWQALIPGVGGLLLGISGHFLQKWRRERPVDPIEANALCGGRMSLRDSVLITGQTILSNGTGGSVGLEASYTQFGSGFASWLGQAFRLRRSDLRTLVGCGSAGAIAAAFGAPLTGAFYAFELILGSYTPFGLAPIGAAAVGGALAGRALGTGGDFVGKGPDIALSHGDMAMLLVLGLACGLFGIVVMRAVTAMETIFRRSRVPAAMRPAIGGCVLGALALITPHVLASGHGALATLFAESDVTLTFLISVLLLKAIASAVSIGSGFRGGLFFASLYLGGLLGRIFVVLIGWIDPALAPDAWIATVVGMAATAVAIVGGPMTMTFLALEATSDLPLAIEMLAVATIVSVMVRRMFGYSFATWRLHLRGESIRSAQDVGWMRDLTVGKLMYTDVPVVCSDLSIAAFREKFPLGSLQWVLAADPQGHYAGIISVIEAYLASLPDYPAGKGTVQGEALREEALREEAVSGRELREKPVSEKEKGRETMPALGEARVSRILRQKESMLLPEMNVKMAAYVFERSECEALAVVADEQDRHIIGLLTESRVLRRYTEELDKVRRDLSGENWLPEK